MTYTIYTALEQKLYMAGLISFPSWATRTTILREEPFLQPKTWNEN